MSEKGTLYIVATPIGNLEDITLRALRILKEVDIIAAEDTRQTVKLLNYFQFSKPLVSYYEHNKKYKGRLLIEKLQEGQSIALVSDAGTPGISDPGEDLIKLAIEEGIEVTMIPGAAAVIMGVVLSGLPSGRFTFEGFLSVNKRSRKERLLEIKNETRTMVFYEAPHKLIYTLKDFFEVLGDRKIALARELTKKHEEIIRCSLSKAVEKYSNEAPKGEYVLIVEGANPEELKLDETNKWQDVSILDHYQMLVDSGMDKKMSVKQVALDRGLSKRDVYNEIVKNK